MLSGKAVGPAIPCSAEVKIITFGRLFGGAGIEDISDFAGLFLHDGSAPIGWGHRRIDPGFEGHARGEIEGVGVIDGDQAITIEGHGVAEFPLGAPRGALEGRGIVIARRISRAAAGPFP